MEPLACQITFPVVATTHMFLLNQTAITFRSNSNKLGAASVGFNEATCRKALAKFLILDEQPSRIVKGEGFKLLVQQLQPQFTPQSC